MVIRPDWMDSLFKLLYDRGHDGIFFLSSCTLSYICGGRRGRDRMAVLPVQSVRIPNSEVYSIKFVSDLRQVSDFLWFPPPIKLTTITEILLKVALNTINQPNQPMDMILFLLQKNIRHLDYLFLTLYCWQLLSLE